MSTTRTRRRASTGTGTPRILVLRAPGTNCDRETAFAFETAGATTRALHLNAWLGKRLDVRQGGKFAPFVKVRGLWVDFKQDQIELIIERELPSGKVHVTSLFMGFEQGKRGFSISRHSCHIGQVRLPGGFGRLLMPAFDNLAQELEDDLTPYYNMRIHDVRVEDGKITLDPRLPDERL